MRSSARSAISSPRTGSSATTCSKAATRGAGLVSDVQLYESSPPRYLADVSRRHRWIRGDWQISPWLLPRVPGPSGRRLDNPLSALSRWKIFDNLRRSLVGAGATPGADRGLVGAEPALVLDSRRGRDQPVPAAAGDR